MLGAEDFGDFALALADVAASAGRAVVALDQIAVVAATAVRRALDVDSVILPDAIGDFGGVQLGGDFVDAHGIWWCVVLLTASSFHKRLSASTAFFSFFRPAPGTGRRAQGKAWAASRIASRLAA